MSPVCMSAGELGRISMLFEVSSRNGSMEFVSVNDAQLAPSTSMTTLSPWNNNSSTERQLALQLARQLGSMDLAVAVTKVSMRGLGDVHRYAAHKASRTLAAANHMVKASSYAGRRLTPEKEAQLRQHTLQYLDQMLRIADDAGDEIIGLLSGY